MSDCAETPTVPGLVSVVTAACNRSGDIADTLESVLGQDYPQVESIVVDDGSIDDTASVLEGCADNPRGSVVRQANAGQTGAENRGLREARGGFIAFCDADDTWRRDKLSRQLPRFADLAVAVVCSDIECVDGQGLALPYYDTPHYEGRVTAPWMIDNFVPFQIVVVRSAVLRAAGGLDESLTMSIDRAYAHVYVPRGYWHAREGRRAEVWRDYQVALRSDPLAVRRWNRTISLRLDREGQPPAATA